MLQRVRDLDALDLGIILPDKASQTLADELHYSKRFLEKSFQSVMGIRPNQLIRIVRFQNFLFQLSHSTATRLTDLALQNGYYDQSHLIREFKNYTDLTPNQFAKAIDSSHDLSRLVLTNPAVTEQEI